MKSDFVFLFRSLPTPTHGHLLQVTLLRQSTSLQPKISQCSQVISQCSQVHSISQCSQVHSTSQSWCLEHWLAQIWSNLLSCREWITQFSHQNSSQCRQQVRNCMFFTTEKIQPKLWMLTGSQFLLHKAPLYASNSSSMVTFLCVCNVWTYSWLSQLRKLYCSEVVKAKTVENDGKFHC